MSSTHLTDAEIRALGWAALVEKLSPSGAIRFAIQTERGFGDYGTLRHEMLGSLTVDELLEQMRRARTPPGSVSKKAKPKRSRRKR